MTMTNKVGATALLALVSCLTNGAVAGIPPVNIGTLGWQAYIEDINESGQVVGYSVPDFAQPGRSFYWSEETGILDLGLQGGLSSGAEHITDAGVVLGRVAYNAPAGFGYGVTWKGFYWTETTGLIFLPSDYGIGHQILAVDRESGQAVGINCANRGGSGGSCDDYKGFSWSLDGGMHDLGTLCYPTDVNSSGQATGYCGGDPFIWDAVNGKQLIEDGAMNCYAEAINDHGQVVGNCGGNGAFSWTEASGLTTWEVPLYNTTYAQDVNNSGLVAGQAIARSPSATTVWVWSQAAGLILMDVGSEYDTSLSGGGGNGISDSGHLFGRATLKSGGPQYGFVWSEGTGAELLIFEDGRNSSVTAMNDYGEVAGSSSTAEFAIVGFSWSPTNGFVQLDPLFFRSDAFVINNRGQIGGYTYDDPGGYLYDWVGAIWNTLPVGRFKDVRGDYWAFQFIESLAEAGVTSGCGDGNYCPTAAVTRAQMAVFLERGINGSDFSPPTASGNVFLDVGAGDFAAGFIEQLYADGITAGCGNNNYCPDSEVTRGQMAVFLLRAKYGSSYSPPTATGLFNDVPLNYWAARWIEQLAAEGITAGCGGGNYCPEAPVNRDQMAVFLVRTFGL